MCLGSRTTLVEQLTHEPFSVPLAQHLEGIDFFIRHMSFPPKLHTFRIILQAKLAPNLEQELASRTSFMVPKFLRGTDIIMLFVIFVFQNNNWPNPKSH
jgi:transformation/transcription domain-associated protein